MVPGKKYAPEDYLRIAWRRKWLIVIPLVLSAVGTFLYSRQLPNVYRSEAVVLIIPQQIPEKYVRPTVDSSITARLDLMRQQILSRARLEAIIEEFDLYPEERKVMLPDQVVEKMKGDIGVVPQRVGRKQSPNHFVVSYQSGSPQKAVRVTERISSLFMREHAETRTLQTDATIQYLQRLVDESLRQLQDYEGRLAEFKRVNAGRLPEEVGTGLQVMAGARQQMQTLSEAITRDRERQIALERQIADETLLGPALAPRRNAGPDATTALPAAQQLATARAALDALLLRLKEDHPDVRIARNHVRDLEKRAEAEALQQPVTSATGVAAITPAEAARQKQLSKLKGELERLEREIETKEAALVRAQASLAEQERRIQAAPGLQTEMTEMMRGYEALKGQHGGLLSKLQDAKLGSTLEQQQVSQQLRIVDPPRRPDRPRSPDRLRMNLMGALAGLGFGLLVAGLLEYRDTSLRTDEDVLVALSLPVLALVPTIRSNPQPRFGRRLRLGSSAGVVLLLGLVFAAWTLGALEAWGR